jgi:hypothetical protein
MWKSLIGLVLTAALAGGNAGAQTPCEQFAWPVQREIEWLNSTNLPVVSSGATVASDGPFMLVLEPTSSVHYLVAPERTPKTANTLGGVVTIRAPTRPGMYQVTLGDEAWIDVVQNGRLVGSTAFTGKVGCKGVRKSVRFEISSGPVIIQISGAVSERLAVAVAPAD